MSITVKTQGTDAYITSLYPKNNFADAHFPAIDVTAGTKRKKTLVHLSGVPDAVNGAVVLSATLTATMHGPVGAGYLVDIRPISESWTKNRVTYNNEPATIGPTVTVALPVTASGSTVDLDVTSLVQAIAAGQPNYGWLLTLNPTGSSGGLQFYGFGSGTNPWTLTVETSDQPGAPAQIAPAGIISLDRWQCQIEDQDDVAQVRVLVDAAANSTSPAFDSGWVPTTIPVLDLAATSYAGLADGATTNWCMAVKTSTGTAGAFSDWAEVTRHSKPTLVMDSPPAGLVYDSTPTIEAHLEQPAGTTVGNASTRWQVVLIDQDDATQVLYDSGAAINGPTLTQTIPHSWRNKVVIRNDGAYRLQVRCWDRPDRVGSYGDLPYLIVDETLSVDTDGTVAAPSGLVVSQPLAGAPDVLLHWTAAADPDYFTIDRRDGTTWSKLPIQVDVDRARVAPGVYEWVDATASPHVPHSWRIRGHVAGKQSPQSVSVTFTPSLLGVWIRSGFGSVVMAGIDLDNIKQITKSTTYAIPYGYEDVDIIGNVGGYAADTINLALKAKTIGTWVQDVDAARAVLEKVRRNPSRPVQLVWGTVSIPVYLRDLSVAPYSKMDPDRDRTHSVSFGFFQTDDVDQAGFGVGYYGAGTYY